MDILTGIGVITSLMAPIALALALILIRPATRAEWVLSVCLTLALALFAGLTGAWFLLTRLLRAPMAVTVILAVVLSWLRWRHLFAEPGARRAAPRVMLPYAVPTGVFAVLSAIALLGRVTPAAPVDLAFPLRGRGYHVAQGGATGIINAHHRYGSQIYAVDLLRLNAAGRNAEPLRPSALDQYAIYGEVIYSPCDGIVATTVDGLNDLAPGTAGDRANPAGNHVYIDCQAEAVQVLLAHMQSGSVAVSAGDPVRAGGIVGRTGNSGNTTEPHLHIHARRGGTLDDPTSGTGVPILFGGHFAVRNDSIDGGPAPQ